VSHDHRDIDGAGERAGRFAERQEQAIRPWSPLAQEQDGFDPVEVNAEPSRDGINGWSGSVSRVMGFGSVSPTRRFVAGEQECGSSIRA